MSKVLNLLRRNQQKNPPETTAIPQTNPELPESQQFYLTLFRRLLANVPPEMKKNPALFTQIKMLQVAVAGMKEETAFNIAQHIKQFGAHIYQAEIEAGLIKIEDTNKSA